MFARQKSRFVQLARDEGLLVPATAVVDDVQQLRATVAEARFPLVLKRDESTGGQGVRIVANANEAERNFIELRHASGRIKALTQTLDRRDASYLARFFRPDPAIILQEYIEGRPANRAVMCRQGKVLAGLSVEALQTSRPAGPASVVRVIDSPDMTEATALLVKRLGLSGFVGFDFMIHAGSGRAYLLEMNGRPTPICHIALDRSTDMISALGEPFTVTRRALNIDSPIIALFPEEIWRDPDSHYLRSAWHDVPHHAAEFVTLYADPVAPEPVHWLRATHKYVRGRMGHAMSRATCEDLSMNVSPLDEVSMRGHRHRADHSMERHGDHASDDGRGDRRCGPLRTVNRGALVAARCAVPHIRQADGDMAHADAPRHASEV